MSRAHPAKILVISLAGIGDTLLATPMIRELRSHFPQARIDALVRWRGSRDLLENNPHLNQIHQTNPLGGSKLESLRFLNSLRRVGYDVSINVHPQSRVHYRIVARMIGARLRLSHDYECSGWWDRFLVNRTVPQDYSIHTTQNNLALLSFLGIEVTSGGLQMEVFFTASEEQWADAYVRERGLGGKVCLGMHVGSGSTKNLMLKRWPLENYVKLIERLNRERPDIQVLLFGGPEEREAHRVISETADPKLVFQPETKNFRQAGALMKRCHCFLSVDSSLMHLAASVGVPKQVIIETPTFNTTLAPFWKDYVLVPNPAVGGRNLEYYLYDGKGIKGSREELIRCMNSVKVEEVFTAITRCV